MRAKVSVAIVTFNRRDEVLKAVGSALAQQWSEKEVLVFDGGSSDGTVEALRSRFAGFPELKILQCTEDPGFVALRNRLAKEARGDILVYLDDDAYLSGRRTFEGIVGLFECCPATAVAALPFISPADVARRFRARRLPPPGSELACFTGCAWAIRREVALGMGPFREIPDYYRDDRDLSVRLLDRGYEIRLARGEPVVHLHSPARDWERRLRLDVISVILFDWLNVPWPYFPGRAAKDIVSLVLYRATLARMPARLQYVWEGLLRCYRHRRLRSPVRATTWRRYRRLPTHGIMQWEGPLPAPVLPESSGPTAG